MKKETFIEAIESIKKQIELDTEVASNLEKAFPECYAANLLPRNHYLSNALMKVLQEEMNDTDGISWIEYYCFELNFGEENYRLKVYRKGSEIKLTTPEDLYNLLIS